MRKVLGEKGTEAALQKLDELSHDDARTAATQTLEVVYCLIQNMSVVTGGEETHSVL